MFSEVSLIEGLVFPSLKKLEVETVMDDLLVVLGPVGVVVLVVTLGLIAVGVILVIFEAWR